MDKNRIRELAGLEVITEGAVITWRNPGKGPNINLSTSDFSFGKEADFIEASFSSGKVAGKSRQPGGTDRKEEEKILNQKLKALIKLQQKFEKDVIKVLEK